MLDNILLILKRIPSANLKTMKYFFILFLLLYCTLHSTAQITTDSSPTLQTTANTLVDSWDWASAASNVRINGISSADISHPRVGLMNAQNSSFYFQESMILATKNIHIAHCEPETDGNTDIEASTDDDLFLLSGTFDLFNITMLEFDFVANSDSLYFDFVFASREYSDDLCNANNDVIGIFLSGPGLNGPFSNNAENIARIPTNNMAINVHSVNNGQSDPLNKNISSGVTCYFLPDSSQCPCFPQFFTDNGSGNGSGLHSELCFGGYTTPIQAYAYLIPGETYSIKMAVANINADEKESALIISLDDLITVDIAENQRSYIEWSLFPNPAADGNVNIAFELSQPSDAEIEITNSLGQLVFQRTFSNLQAGTHQQNLQVSNLTDGIYLVRLETVFGVSERKMVIR